MKRIKLMQKHGLFVVLFTLAITNIILLLFISQKKTNENPEKDYSEVKARLLVEMSKLKDENNVINSNSIIIDQDFNEVTLSSLLKKHPVLFLKISKIYCNSCIELNIKLLNSFYNAHNIKEGNVIILYEKANFRDVKLLSRSLNNKIPIYQINDNNFQLEMDKLNVPYFYLMDMDCKPRLIHVNSKTFPDFTNKYLNYIHNEFLLNN